MFPEGVARGKHVTRVLPRGKKPFLPVNTIFFSFFENIGTMENIDLLCYFYPVMEYNITTRWNIQPVISWFQLKIAIFGDFGPFFGKKQKKSNFFLQNNSEKISKSESFFYEREIKWNFWNFTYFTRNFTLFPAHKKKGHRFQKLVGIFHFHIISLGSIKWMSGK